MEAIFIFFVIIVLIPLSSTTTLISWGILLLIVCIIFYIFEKSRKLINRGHLKFNIGNCKSAITDWEKAVGITPFFATCQLLLLIGNVNTRKLNSKYADTYFHRGFVKVKFSDLRGAITDWEKAIKLNPSLKTTLLPLIYAGWEEIMKKAKSKT